MSPNEYRVAKMIYKKFKNKQFTYEEFADAIGKRHIDGLHSLAESKFVFRDLGVKQGERRIHHLNLTREAIIAIEKEKRRRMEIGFSLFFGLIAAAFSVLTFFKPVQ